MLTRSDKIAFTLFAIGLTLYAGAKHALPTFTFDSYLADAGSYATNDTVHIAFTQRAQGLDLSTSPVLVYAREMAATNAADWSELSPRRMFPAFPADYVLENATNYNYAIYVDFVPPPMVHTNGVWQMRGVELARSESGTTVAFPNTSAKILPPTVSDYIQDSAVAMWTGSEHGTNDFVWVDSSGNGFDATQRVSTGWSWGDNAYVATTSSGQGFRVPLAINSILRDNISNHTIEIVYKPSGWRRETLFGQYNSGTGAMGGLNIEVYSRSQSFRAYYNMAPDYSVAAWSSTDKSRKTCAVVCNGANTILYVNGEEKGRTTQPIASRITDQYFIIGGENGRNNMSILGSIYRITIHIRALSATELKYNHTIDDRRLGTP